MVEVAKVKYIPTGDQLVVSVNEGKDLVLNLAAINSPKLVDGSLTNLTKPEEPLGAWFCREDLRKRLIGNTVKIESAGKTEKGLEFFFVEIAATEEDLISCLIKEGLAKVDESKLPHPRFSFEVLKGLEAEAKEKELGLWNSSCLKTRQMEVRIRDPQWSQTFVGKFQNQTLKALVEKVLNEKTIHVYLLDHEIYCQVFVNGLTKSILENEYLGKEVEIIPEESSIGGSIVASFSDRNQMMRKQMKLSTETNIYPLEAKVVQVPSADVYSVMAFASCDFIEHRVYLANLRCPRAGSRVRDADPLWWESVEFAIEKVGNSEKVKVELEYKNNGGDDYVTILYGKSFSENLNLNLVSKGFAHVIRQKTGSVRCSNYTELLEAESRAKSQKLGLHGGGAVSTIISGKPKICDLVGPANIQRAKAMENGYRREGSLRGTVVGIVNSSKFVIRLFKDNARIMFLLSGVRGVNREHPFFQESIAYSKFHLMYKNVSIEVDSCDRGGTFIGLLYLHKTLWNVHVIEQGWAKVDENGIRFCRLEKELKQAESSAIESGKRVWQDEKVSKVVEDFIKKGAAHLDEKESVIVSHVAKTSEIFVQQKLDELDRVQELANSVDSHLTFSLPPNEGDLVLAKFSQDGLFYRARIMKASKNFEQFHVFYIDYGNEAFDVALEDLRRLPSRLNAVVTSAVAVKVKLAMVKSIKDTEWGAVKVLKDLIWDKEFWISKLENEIFLYENAPPSSNSINEQMVGMGLFKFRHSIPTKSATAATAATEIAKLKAAQAKAKTDRLGMWVYGDVGSSSDDESIANDL